MFRKSQCYALLHERKQIVSLSRLDHLAFLSFLSSTVGLDPNIWGGDQMSQQDLLFGSQHRIVIAAFIERQLLI
jgi:hypothetical protein